MGIPAAKHFDLILGLDAHIVTIGPVTTPFPNPYIGFVFDATDYVPKMGSTVNVNGRPRGVAGTSGKAVPGHLPIPGPFVKPPTMSPRSSWAR